MNIRNPVEFEKMLLGEFKLDGKYKELDDRLKKYYRESDNLDNKHAIPMYRDFMKWCRSCGFTSREINQAKQRCNHFR